MGEHSEDLLIDHLAETARQVVRRVHADALRGPQPGVEERVLTGVEYEERRGGRRPWIAAAAGVLALFLVAGLLSSRLLGPHTGRSASTGSVVSPAPATVPSELTPNPAPSANRSPSATPSTLPGAGATTCTLPLDYGTGSAFVTLSTIGIPQGQMPSVTQPSPDPSGRPRLPDGEDPVSVSYDWGLRKWLPVAHTSVASSGLSYAYSDRQGSLHVVDAGSGADRSVNSDHLWAVVEYAQEGIYAAARASGSQPASGLWLINAASGNARMIASNGDWEFVGGHTAYGLASPQYAPPNIVYGNSLFVLDLSTGKATTMYTRTDDTFRLLGLDSYGNPYIATWHMNIGAGSAMMEVTAPGTVSPVQGGGIWTDVLADGDRTWFGEGYGMGVWLKDSAGVRRLAQVGYSGPAPQPAGACR